MGAHRVGPVFIQTNEACQRASSASMVCIKTNLAKQDVSLVQTDGITVYLEHPRVPGVLSGSTVRSPDKDTNMIPVTNAPLGGFKTKQVNPIVHSVVTVDTKIKQAIQRVRHVRTGLNRPAHALSVTVATQESLIKLQVEYAMTVQLVTHKIQ